MADPFAAYPDPLPPSRGPRVVVFVVLFVVGFVGVLGVLRLRAPAALEVAAPPGYARISDADAGAGDYTAGRVAHFLGVAEVPGFERALLRAWGRPQGQPPRAVLVLVVDARSAGAAQQLQSDVATAARARGAETFPTPPGYAGWHDVPDRQARYAQRVAFARGDRLYVVSVVTPQREGDTSEVVRLAQAQG